MVGSSVTGTIATFTNTRQLRKMETHAENVVYSLFLRSAKLTELMLGHSWTAESTQAGGLCVGRRLRKENGAGRAASYYIFLQLRNSRRGKTYAHFGK